VTAADALHVVVPYPATNSSVRTRALHWIERLDASAGTESTALVYGPGFRRGSPPPGTAVLLLRNARRFTRGRHEASLLRRASLGVYDLDDGLPWDDGDLPGLGHWWKRPWPRSLVARRAAAAADRMVVGNEVLADWASEHCADVRLVPTCVEPDEYARRTDWGIADREPVIGWIGSPATQGYVLDIVDALVVAHERSRARVELVGASPAVVPTDLAGFTTVVPWDEADARCRLATWDVGIMPLRDGPYERAKCGYKLLQYAASGVPAIGSPVGVNRTMLADMSAPAPVGVDEWTDALLDVLGASSDRRSAMARAGVELADRYSYDAWEAAWVDAVEWPAS
jgi:glycosyltransferase involved in cell wall biosynthesis